MHRVGYAGIAYLPTSKVAVLLENGSWVTLSAEQGQRLVRSRAEDRLPPIPVIDAPSTLPARNPVPGGRALRPGTTVDVPPSILPGPLVLWSTGGDALRCERVIRYGGGFEVELKAPGLLDETAEQPWGRSTRGFWQFHGLRLSVGFSNGLEQRIEDLTDEDRDGPMMVSPFQRRGSSDDTLWLWVVPLPPDGAVRLVATWPLRGIEGATAEFTVLAA
jgi:hypothetical protein